MAPLPPQDRAFRRLFSYEPAFLPGLARDFATDEYRMGIPLGRDRVDFDYVRCVDG